MDRGSVSGAAEEHARVVTATAWMRAMRGGSQAQLLACDDGRSYVVKFRNNPQHERVLINEWIGTSLLSWLGLPTPRQATVVVDASLLDRFPELRLVKKKTSERPCVGAHWGSEFPGDPHQRAIYDFLPDLLLGKLTHREVFLGAIVFDQWVANIDARQVIFARAPPEQERRQVFCPFLIDQGGIFGGERWELAASPLHGRYHRSCVYQHVTGWGAFEPWIERLQSLDEAALWRSFLSVPSDWREGSNHALERLCTQLDRRRSRIANLLNDVREASPELFPRWISSS